VKEKKEEYYDTGVGTRKEGADSWSKNKELEKEILFVGRSKNECINESTSLDYTGTVRGGCRKTHKITPDQISTALQKIKESDDIP